MKNVVALFLVVGLMLSLVACGGTQQSNLKDAFSTALNDTDQQTASTDVDYSSYARLLEENMAQYGDLIFDEMSDTQGTVYNCAGLSYANLIDLDSNGVLELITITVQDAHGSLNNGGTALNLYYDENGDALSPISVYTLTQYGEIILLDSLMLSAYGNGGVRYGVEYSSKGATTYVLESLRSNIETAVYYELQDSSALEQVANVEILFDYETGETQSIINGEAYDDMDTATEKIKADYGDVWFQPISWLTQEELNALMATNLKTFEFLGVNTQGSASENSSENSDVSDIYGNLQDVDYSAYSALLKAYELDYNRENLSATDYRLKGMTLKPTNIYGPDESMVDASGFCYANLVDLDGDGVLELVLIAYDDQEYAEYSEDNRIQDLEYENIIRIYTISAEIGLRYLGELPVSSITMPVSVNYGIEYIVSADKTYISYRNVMQMGDGVISYYGMENGHFDLITAFEIGTDGSAFVDGVNYSQEEVDKIMASYGESKVHLISNLNDIYLEELKGVTQQTYAFLADYPIDNFDDYSGTYNDGQFFFMEHGYTEMLEQEFAIRDYYKAITMRDYDALAELNIRSEVIDNFKRAHTSSEHTYVPGYMVSDIDTVTTDMIEHPDMAADIAEYVDTVQSDNVIIMRCRVNEVLDPHTAQLGLQVAGDTYETYFILYSDDPDGQVWKIAEIYDDKFYMMH